MVVQPYLSPSDTSWVSHGFQANVQKESGPFLCRSLGDVLTVSSQPRHCNVLLHDCQQRSDPLSVASSH